MSHIHTYVPWKFRKDCKVALEMEPFLLYIAWDPLLHAWISFNIEALVQNFISKEKIPILFFFFFPPLIGSVSINCLRVVLFASFPSFLPLPRQFPVPIPLDRYWLAGSLQISFGLHVCYTPLCSSTMELYQ